MQHKSEQPPRTQRLICVGAVYLDTILSYAPQEQCRTHADHLQSTALPRRRHKASSYESRTPAWRQHRQCAGSLHPTLTPKRGQGRVQIFLRAISFYGLTRLSVRRHQNRNAISPQRQLGTLPISQRSATRSEQLHHPISTEPVSDHCECEPARRDDRGRIQDGRRASH